METSSTLLALGEGNSLAQVNSPYKGQRRGTLMFSLICAWTNSWANDWDPVIWDALCLLGCQRKWTLMYLTSLAKQMFVQQLVQLTTKKTSKPYIIGPLWGESISGFPPQRVSNEEKFSTSSCHSSAVWVMSSYIAPCNIELLYNYPECHACCWQDSLTQGW